MFLCSAKQLKVVIKGSTSVNVLPTLAHTLTGWVCAKVTSQLKKMFVHSSRGEEPRLWQMRQIVCKKGHAEGASQGARRQPRVPVRRVRERSSHASLLFSHRVNWTSRLELVVVELFWDCVNVCLPRYEDQTCSAAPHEAPQGHQRVRV